jgi:hypothetical protein
MNIYVGNLAFDTAEDEIRQAFSQYGTVTSVNIIGHVGLDYRIEDVGQKI